MGVYSEEALSSGAAMLPAGPWDFDLLMNCFIDLHLRFAYLETPTTIPLPTMLFTPF